MKNLSYTRKSNEIEFQANGPMKTGLRRGALLASVSAILALGALPAYAQDQAAPEKAEKTESAVVVTGSRLKSTGYDRPTPVTVATTEVLKAVAPMTLSDGLFQLPQNVGSKSRAFCCEVGTIGNYLNLRGIGPARTLILLDGQRAVPSNEYGQIDLNILPEALVSRVDIVTGGASAAYGSDAVSGVVNYVINKNYEGYGFNVQGGVSQYDVDKSAKYGVMGGWAFEDGRGHLVASYENFRVDGIKHLDDIPLPRAHGFLGGNGTAAFPYTAYRNTVSLLATDGGVILVDRSVPLPLSNPAFFGPLNGLMFTGPNSWRNFQYGTPISPTVPGLPFLSNVAAQIGGDGLLYNTMQPIGSLETDKFFTNLNYEMTNGMTFHARVFASRSQNRMAILQDARFYTTAYQIFRDNAYLPAGIGGIMDAIGQTSIILSRANIDWGTIDLNNQTESLDFNAGLAGRLADKYDWSFNVSYGKNRLDARVENDPITTRVYAAADAVVNPANGQIVCRVTLTNPGLYPGCVPMNVFGNGSPSAASIAYVNGTSKQNVTNTQTSFSFDIQGSLFEMPSGSADFAAGVEYRKRTLVQDSNQLATTQINPTGVRGFPDTYCPTPTTCQFGNFREGNFGTADADDDVKEAYVELEAPLLKDQALAKNLGVNLAYRVTDYKNSGSVSTWKAGLTWALNDDFKIRATRSRDIRAPNLFELFAGDVFSYAAAVNDPVTGQNNIHLYTRTTGNPNLQPEEADTTSYGLIYKPSFIPGLQGSIDYYKIDLQKALSATTAQGTIDGCFQGNAALCALIQRDGTNRLVQVTVQQINLNSREVDGIDYDISYNREVWGGRFSTHLTVTNMRNYIDTIGGTRTNYIGLSNFGNQLTLPKWRGNLVTSYTKNGWTFLMQNRYIGGYTLYNLGAIFADPKISPLAYTDITISKKMEVMNHNVEFYGTVNNVFNLGPPFVPNPFVPALAVPTVPGLYDLDYRYFTGGIRFKF